MSIVYRLESFKIMAALPIVSLCSFVGIGLKRWDERNNQNGQNQPKDAFVPVEQSVNAETNERRKRVATFYKDNPSASYQAVADALGISKTMAYNDAKRLKRLGVLSEQNGETTVNGHYEQFVNG